MSFGVLMYLPSEHIEECKSTDQKSADVPSGDLISRQWLLDLYDIDTTNFKETAKVPLEVVIQNIKDAPTIEHSGDLISREDAIAYIDRVTNSGLGKHKSLEYIRKYISALPSADRQIEHDGCDGCQHEHKAETEYPCTECKQNYRDKYRRKENTSSADRPRGEWIENDALGWKCSKCGIITNLESNFCPCCGADMRGDNNE